MFGQGAEVFLAVLELGVSCAVTRRARVAVRNRKTYAAEEVPDKDDKHSSGLVVAHIKALERSRLAMTVQHDVIFNHLLDIGRWQLVVRRQLAVKVLRLGLVDVDGSRLRPPVRRCLFRQCMVVFVALRNIVAFSGRILVLDVLKDARKRVWRGASWVSHFRLLWRGCRRSRRSRRIGDISSCS